VLNLVGDARHGAAAEIGKDVNLEHRRGERDLDR
jgi:hypothetical protein